MPHIIKNLSGYPLDISTANGPVLLPANGEVSATLGAYDADVLRHSPWVTISEAVAEKPKADPLDHDGDGKRGGSKPASDEGDEVAALRSKYTELTGEEPDGRWGKKRLRDEIAKAKD